MPRSALLLIAATLLTASPGWSMGGHTNAPSAKPIIETRALSPTEQAIQDLLDRYASALEQASLELAETAVLVGDFTTIESGYANWSWEDFRDAHLSAELKMFSDIDYKMELLAGEMQGELGFAIYRFTASGIPKGATEPVSVSGLATAIIEQTDDGLRIHHIHSSTPRQGAGQHGT